MSNGNNVINIDKFKSCEQIIKQRLQADGIVVCTADNLGGINVYISEELPDMELVYMIQTLQDLRQRRLQQ
jgi:hypothetical protein